MIHVFLAALTLSGAPAAGGDARPVYTITRAAVAPAVDGHLDDEAWKGVPEWTGFTQSEPNDGAPATDQTRVRMVYTADALYVAAIMDAPQGTPSLLLRRDGDLGNGDILRVALDTERTRSAAFAFLVNPSNVQRDFLLYNDTLVNAAWNGVWESATRILPHAWQAELRIPFAQLRFPKTDQQLWGFNISRWNIRLREFAHLVPIPRSQTGVVSRFADLAGIRGIETGRRLELLPYIASRTDSRLTHPLLDRPGTTVHAGLDAKFGLTPSLTVTATVNPDFGQVEVDPAVVNLTQFETFLTEQRPFFTEGAPLFELGAPTPNRWAFGTATPMPFYSRRIGRAPQRVIRADGAEAPLESTILSAVKLTGRTAGGWSLGVLDAVTEREQGTFAMGSSTQRHEIEPLTNYFVMRAAKETARARNGILLTAVNRSLSAETAPFFRGTAYFLGADGYRWLGERAWLWDWQLGASRITGSPAAIADAQRSPARYFQRPDAEHVDVDGERTSLSGYMGKTTLAREIGRLRPQIQLQVLSPGLELNDLGFVPRVDDVNSHALLYYENTDPTPRKRQLHAWIGKYNAWNFAGDPTADGVASFVRVERPNYSWVELSGGRRAAVVDDKAARGGPSIIRPAEWYVSLRGGTDPRAELSVDGVAERLRRTDGGFRNTVSATLRWRPASALAISAIPRYQMGHVMSEYVAAMDAPGDGPLGKRYVFSTMEHREFQIGARAEWTVSPALTFQLYVQPLAASARYHSFKHLLHARSADFAPTAAPPVDPDFSRRSLRGSAIVRWEYRRGSAIYLAWNELRDDTSPHGDLRIGRDFRAIGDAPARDVIALKVSYWFSP
jgi:hypothetical protein